MTRWEYRVETVPPNATTLAGCGAEGWELCGAAGGLLYFKRPAPSLQDRVTLDQRGRVLTTGRPLEAPPPSAAPATPRLLHPELRRLLASAGHTDLIVVCDRGFPVPPSVERIDLALTDGVPTVLDVLRCVQTEVHCDRLVLAEEARAVSAARVRELAVLLSGTPHEFVPHIEFKALARSARGIVRTGDAVPYANVILALG